MHTLIGFGSGLIGSLALIGLFRLWARRNNLREWLFAVPFAAAVCTYTVLLWSLWPWFGVWSVSIAIMIEALVIIFTIRAAVKRGRTA